MILTDGDMAIQFIEDIDANGLSCPALVIMDLNLPKKPGRAVLEVIRESKRCREVPVLILSSSDAHMIKLTPSASAQADTSGNLRD